MKHCCICGQLFEGYGNNPAPISTRGECCDDCNINLVVPRRLLDAKKAKVKADADALTSTPLQRAESAKLNALVGAVVEIEYIDGDVDVGILHKDTPAIKYQNPDGDNTTICGYYIERTTTDDGDVHFKKSHVKAIRPTCVTGKRDARLDKLVGKSVLIDFRNGDTEAGFLHRITTTCGSGDEIVRYSLVMPCRNIVFYSTDVKSVREG